MSGCPTPWKVSYETRAIAKASVWKRKGGGKRGIGGQLRPYRCVCGMWHLTHMARNDLRRVRKGMRR